MNSFQIAVQFLVDRRDGFDAEGGYVNNPKDPGGETNYGISKRAHPNIDIKNLTLQGAMDIYKEKYWDFYSLEEVSMPLAVCILDAYVQHRPTVVGQFIKIAGEDWKLFNATRREFYLRLVSKDPAKYQWAKKGWLNRMNQLDKYCEIVLQELEAS